MFSSTTVAATEEFTVSAVRCADGRPGWSEPEPVTRHQVVLVRSGRFRLRSRHDRMLVDATTGYAQAPGDEGQFAHPAGGDVCTAIAMSPDLWRGPSGAVRVSARADVAHRLLLRTTPDVAYETTERLLELLVHLTPTRERRARRALVQEAREAIVSRHPDAAGLVSLARSLEVSPSYLSRTFRQEAGMSLTQYRNRVRVGWALDRIEKGEADLSGLAADLGFADHAHLTRTVKAETGRPPTRLRDLLARRSPLPITPPTAGRGGREG